MGLACWGRADLVLVEVPVVVGAPAVVDVEQAWAGQAWVGQAAGATHQLR